MALPDGTRTDPVSCPGCGLVGGSIEGPTHRYMLSSPRCWALHGELLATGPTTQLAVDAYAAQHPGNPERRAIQSVGLHLVSLCAAFERDWRQEHAIGLIRRAAESGVRWQWLDPNPPVGSITVADVVAEDEWPARQAAVRIWAEDVWATYSEHHSLIRVWLDSVLGE